MFFLDSQLVVLMQVCLGLSLPSSCVVGVSLPGCFGFLSAPPLIFSLLRAYCMSAPFTAKNAHWDDHHHWDEDHHGEVTEYCGNYSVDSADGVYFDRSILPCCLVTPEVG